MRTSLSTLLAPLFLLAACGYAPLYAPVEGDVAAASHVQIGEVTMDSITGVSGQPVTKNVGQRRVAQTVSQRLQLDYPQHAATLDVATISINETTGTLAMQTTSALQRAQINLNGTLTIISPEGKTLVRTTLTTTSAYNVEDSPYSTESGKAYARLTAAHTLADELSRRIALYYRTRHLNPTAVAPEVVIASPTQLVTFTVPLPFKK